MQVRNKWTCKANVKGKPRDEAYFICKGEKRERSQYFPCSKQMHAKVQGGRDRGIVAN